MSRYKKKDGLQSRLSDARVVSEEAPFVAVGCVVRGLDGFDGVLALFEQVEIGDRGACVDVGNPG